MAGAGCRQTATARRGRSLARPESVARFRRPRQCPGAAGPSDGAARAHATPFVQDPWL